VEDEIIIRINGSTIDEAAEGRGSHDTHQSPPKGASSSIIFFWCTISRPLNLP